MKNQNEIRAAFWETYPELADIARHNRTISKGQNAQTATCRSCFVGYIDSLARCGEINAALADRATL